MGIRHLADGSIELQSDINPSVIQVLPPGTSQADVETAAAAMFPPPRYLLKKSTLIRRCHEAGILPAIMSILDMPANVYAKARWWSPDWPEVYFDDPDMVGMLTAIGADIPTITAPE